MVFIAKLFIHNRLCVVHASFSSRSTIWKKILFWYHWFSPCYMQEQLISVMLCWDIAEKNLDLIAEFWLL